MKLNNYEERLKISVSGNDKTIFKTKSGTILAKGYTRIVIGERGPYIEFESKHISHYLADETKIPDNEIKRLDDDKYYYIERRSLDEANVKIYKQKKTVDYADYKIGMYYISPFDLLADDNIIIERLVKDDDDYDRPMWFL